MFREMHMKGRIGTFPKTFLSNIPHVDKRLKMYIISCWTWNLENTYLDYYAYGLFSYIRVSGTGWQPITVGSWVMIPEHAAMKYL